MQRVFSTALYPNFKNKSGLTLSWQLANLIVGFRSILSDMPVYGGEICLLTLVPNHQPTVLSWHGLIAIGVYVARSLGFPSFGDYLVRHPGFLKSSDLDRRWWDSHQ